MTRPTSALLSRRRQRQLALCSQQTLLRAPIALALSTLTMLLGTSAARAVVTPVGSPQFGVEPHSVTPLTKEPKLPLTYHGGPVMHSNATYAIYWDPTRSVSWNYDGDWKGLIDEFLQAVGHESGALHNIYAVAGQYTDSSGRRAANSSVFRGAYTDTASFPASGCTDPNPEPEKFACLTDAQLRTELTGFIASHGLQTGRSTLFFLLTPPGVTVCTDEGGPLTGRCSDSSKGVTERESYRRSFCSYHSYIGSETNPTIYAVEPWTAGNSGMFLVLKEEFGTVSGSDCQDGSGLNQEPNQLPSPGLDTDGDYDAGLADLVINEISVEQIAAETNPLLNGWYAPTDQANAGNEVPDQCRNVFAAVPMGGASAPPQGSRTEAGTLFNQSLDGKSYYLNDEFNQAALSMDYPGVPCLSGVNLVPRFTAPNPVNSGDIVGFDASESNITLDAGQNYTAGGVPFNTYPTYIWNFGDGTETASSSPPGASPVDQPSAFHSYQYGGTYRVTLTVTDVGGNTATFSRTITVLGPPPPPTVSSSGTTEQSGTPSGTSAPSGSSTTTSTTSSTSTAAVATGTPAPTVYDYVLSRSLKKVLRYGLAIRYSVNEQVAGGIEVMLDRRTARRLGIHGPAAKGLPAGYARSIVLGGAVLVTTQAGQGTLRLRFLKPLPKRLAHVRRLKLTLRIVVRNADRFHPKTATLLSTVVLKG